MAKCEKCGVEVYLPFICPYCKASFCVHHRLPENHGCPNLIMAKAPMPKIVETSEFKRRSKIPVFRTIKSSLQTKRSSNVSEVRDLLISWIVLGICFSFGDLLRGSYTMFLVALVGLGSGFIFHELAHKFVAQRYGCLAKFRLWTYGLMMALTFAVVSGGSFVFAAPGAVYISSGRLGFGNSIDRKRNGLISLSGALANIAIAALFFLLPRINPIISLIAQYGFRVNLWLAAFNLIPLGPLDGQKVLHWNPGIWAVVTVPVWTIILLPPLL